MKTLRGSIDFSVLLTEAEYSALSLDNRLARDGMAHGIDGYVAEHPLLKGRESTVRVGLLVKDAPKELQLVA